MSQLHSKFGYITNPINPLQKYLEAYFCTFRFRCSSECPFVGSPCWCHLWRIIKAICI